MFFVVRVLIIFGFIHFSFTTFAKEDSRPLSTLGNNLVEFTLGVAFEKQETVHEIGFDYEYFIPAMDHHLSLGIASEVEFQHDGPQYLIAPLVSLYYYHTKVFLSSGFLTDFSHKNRWKTRFGVGYEVFIDEHNLIVVPTFAWDMVEGEQYPAIVLGIAREF